MTKDSIIYRPMPGPQEQFLALRTDIAFYGGASGCGKTYALILSCLSNIEHSKYRAVLFVSSIYVFISRYENIISDAGGTYSELNKVWTFKSGSEIHLSQNNYESKIFDFIGIDDVNRFSEHEFWYIYSRLNRENCKYFRCYMRIACNAEYTDVSWLRETLSWWIDLDGNPIRERAGKHRPIKSLFLPLRRIIKSLTFIPATIHDNKILLRNNPEYLQHIESMISIDINRLLYGSWTIHA